MKKTKSKNGRLLLRRPACLNEKQTPPGLPSPYLSPPSLPSPYLPQSNPPSPKPAAALIRSPTRLLTSVSIGATPQL